MSSTQEDTVPLSPLNGCFSNTDVAEATTIKNKHVKKLRFPKRPFKESRRNRFPFSSVATELVGTVPPKVVTEELMQILGKSKKDTIAGLRLSQDRGLVFGSHLKDQEYVYLNAAEFGEVEIVKDLIEEREFNSNCVDYMGRNALLLAMKTENIELIDNLIAKLGFHAVEDALLHAISQERIHLVKLIVDHPQYIRMESLFTAGPERRIKPLQEEKRGLDRSQFSSDITPLMLAAHANNHEIIQLLLDRGHKLEMPHDRSCLCMDCELTRAEVSAVVLLP
ncbi:Short transient receptor putative channel 2 [Cichlidogyrus casuarinus]|uniref:Short transient receptor putative channel 2 n=1 Tax=Cichlidogyrus casuarinus TaxID=1844966 RepID=A0ABD2PSR3_9PLAT